MAGHPILGSGAVSPPHAHLGSLGKVVLLRLPVQLKGDSVSGGRRGFVRGLPCCHLAAPHHLQLLQQAPGQGAKVGTGPQHHPMGMLPFSLNSPSCGPKVLGPHSLGQGTFGICKVYGCSRAQQLLQVAGDQLLLRALDLPGQGHGRQLLLRHLLHRALSGGRKVAVSPPPGQPPHRSPGEG